MGLPYGRREDELSLENCLPAKYLYFGGKVFFG
jgi:hypothetical protein